MNRHYYISDNLDELESVEKELEASGISTEQIHVLSENDAEVAQHHLHDVPSVMKQDLIRSGGAGVMIGFVLALVVLSLSYAFGLTETTTGWLPFIFLAVVLMGFATWEGGLLGIQKSNQSFRQFEQSLHEGKHLFFVDVKATQEAQLGHVLSRHPNLQMAGTGKAVPEWLLASQQKLHQLKRTLGGL